MFGNFDDKLIDFISVKSDKHYGIVKMSFEKSMSYCMFCVVTLYERLSSTGLGYSLSWQELAITINTKHCKCKFRASSLPNNLKQGAVVGTACMIQYIFRKKSVICGLTRSLKQSRQAI